MLESIGRSLCQWYRAVPRRSVVVGPRWGPQKAYHEANQASNRRHSPALSKDVYLWDKSPAGFGVRIRPSGTKTFFYSYRACGGRSATKKGLVIGQHGNLTLDQARKVAQEAAGQVAAGRDPVMERKAAREALERQKLTVATVADQFVEQHVKPRNRTWEEYQRILDYYV